MTDNKPDPKRRPTSGRPEQSVPGGGRRSEPAATLPAGLPPPADDAPAEPVAATRRSILGPTLGVVGFIVLAAAIYWVWQNPNIPPPPPQSQAAQSQMPPPELDSLRQLAATLDARLAKLEQRPAAESPPGVAAPPPVDLGPLTARVAALEARKPPPPLDLGPLQASVAALEKRPTTDPAFAARMDALAARLDTLDSREQANQVALGRRLDTLDGRLALLEREAGQIAALAERAQRTSRIQAAQSALDSGTQLGAIPGAAPALARYAGSPPPTEASLRMSFPTAAEAALAASRPNVDDQPFLDRAWARAQDLVTLRQGDHVIVGDPAAGILGRARAALNAGDLAGAVAAVNQLSGPAAAAMADWKAQAQGLLDARRALADMAAHG